MTLQQLAYFVALADVGLLEGTRALATIDPRAISLTTQPDRPPGSPRNVLHARVEGIDIIGDRARVALDSRPPLVAEVTAEAVIDLELNVATRLWASVKATSIEVYPA